MGCRGETTRAPALLERFKQRVRELTAQHLSLKQLVAVLGTSLRGWRGYFGLGQTPSVMRDLDPDWGLGGCPFEILAMGVRPHHPASGPLDRHVAPRA
ncbi:MAG: hypothetical protein H7338_07255 [Candidatus Sericytochromatia bacterium]|nr:hypothetical protein [Candidatus Sericytochromatia bacterium]